MPKGIYARPVKGGMKTAVVEAPVTPETANARNVQVVSQSGDDSEMSTTQRLFGDLTHEEVDTEIRKADGAIPVTQNPLTEDPPEQVPAPEKKEVPSEPETPPPPTVEDDSFDIEKVLNKKVKTKIDGKEETVTLKDLRDNYQINKHLAQAADKVGEERRKLAEERRQLQELRQHQSQGIPIQTPQNGYQQEPVNGQQQPVPQQLNPLYAKIQSLENQLNQFVQGTQPVLYESNRQRVANELKSQGFDDFLNYIPKMESHIVSLSDPQLVNFYDTPQGAKALYFQLKAQDLNSRPAQQPSVPARQAASVAPPAVQIDGGSQPMGAANDDGASNYRRAFKRATELGTDSPQGREAWNQVLLQKGLIPGE